MFGSLNKIWPWKNTLEWGVDRHGEKLAIIQENVLPNQLVEGNANILFACLLAVFGFVLIFVLEQVASKKEVAA